MRNNDSYETISATICLAKAGGMLSIALLIEDTNPNERHLFYRPANERRVKQLLHKYGVIDDKEVFDLFGDQPERFFISDFPVELIFALTFGVEVNQPDPPKWIDYGWSHEASEADKN